MSLEDIAFNFIISHLKAKLINIISAHPPSGKAYDTDLIRLPAKNRNSGRYHIDVIFESEGVLCLTEIKGSTGESADDIIKLRAIVNEYTRLELIKLIRKRSCLETVDWDNINFIVPVIGAAIGGVQCPHDFVFLTTGSHGNITLEIGTSINLEAKGRLSKLF